MIKTGTKPNARWAGLAAPIASLVLLAGCTGAPHVHPTAFPTAFPSSDSQPATPTVSVSPTPSLILDVSPTPVGIQVVSASGTGPTRLSLSDLPSDTTHLVIWVVCDNGSFRISGPTSDLVVGGTCSAIASIHADALVSLTGKRGLSLAIEPTSRWKVAIWASD